MSILREVPDPMRCGRASDNHAKTVHLVRFSSPPAPVPATGSLSLAPGYTLIKTLFSLPFPMLSIPCASSCAHPHGFFAVFFLCFHQNESFAHKLLNFVVSKGLKFYIIYAIINRNYYSYLTVLPSGCAGHRLFANSASAAKPQDCFMPFSIRRRAQCLKTF